MRSSATASASTSTAARPGSRSPSTIVDLTGSQVRVLREGGHRVADRRGPRRAVRARAPQGAHGRRPDQGQGPDPRTRDRPSRAEPGRQVTGTPGDAVTAMRVADARERAAVLGPGLRRAAGRGSRDRRGRARRARPAARRAAADRQRELHQPGGARRARLDAVEQVRRGLPRPALLRRLRGRRPGRGDRHRARQGAVRRRARQPAAALRRAAPTSPRTPRSASPATPCWRWTSAGRPPHPRQQGQLLRQVVRRRCPTPSARTPS